MNEYSYVILRYSPDRARGECLNFGVVLVAGGCVFPWFEREASERLLAAFPETDAGMFRMVAEGLDAAIRSRNLLTVDTREDAHALMRHIWPDNGLSMYYSEAKVGVGEVSVRELYARWVE